MVSEPAFGYPPGVEAHQKMLPNSDLNRQLFDGDLSDLDRQIYSAVERFSSFGAPRSKFKVQDASSHQLEEMSASAIELGFFQFFLRAMAATRVLEIGTFLGVSAMYFAEALPPDGKVLTIEKYDVFAEVARNNIRSNNLDEKIEVVVGDAMQILEDLLPGEVFDFVFIDGNKENYARYFEMVSPYVRKGGVVAIDDAMFFGDSLNKMPRTEKGAGVRDALNAGASAEEWESLLLPIYNGLFLLRKLS